MVARGGQKARIVVARGGQNFGVARGDQVRIMVARGGQNSDLLGCSRRSELILTWLLEEVRIMVARGEQQN